jgi:hypothetical protein
MLGLHRGGQFTVEDFSQGNGVWLAYMVVPRTPGTAPIGASPDFELGPIIPNSLFPITVTGFSERLGEPFSVLTDFLVPALDASLDPPFDVDGHSHFPSSLPTTSTSGRPASIRLGNMSGRSGCLDATGNGWEITARFIIRQK